VHYQEAGPATLPPGTVLAVPAVVEFAEVPRRRRVESSQAPAARAAVAVHLLLSLPESVIEIIVSYAVDNDDNAPLDLLHLACASCGLTALVMRATREWLAARPAAERAWLLPYHDSELSLGRWMGRMRQVIQLRKPLAFKSVHSYLALGPPQVVVKRSGGRARTATTLPPMHAGRHFAQFTVLTEQTNMHFGVGRPGWDGMGWDFGCYYGIVRGERHPKDAQGPMAHFGESWVGQEPAHAEGDRVGLLLDLGAGSMAVYKNDAWLGVIATGLTGPYVWVAPFLDRETALVSTPCRCLGLQQPLKVG
jgi:hypothetical protein